MCGSLIARSSGTRTWSRRWSWRTCCCRRPRPFIRRHNRKESRGAQAREDFPNRDDANWMKHTLVWVDGPGQVRFDYRPVHLETLTDEVETIPPKGAHLLTWHELLFFRELQDPHRRDAQGAPGASAVRTFRIYRFDPDSGENPRSTRSSSTSEQLRADGARCADPDQSEHRLLADFPALVPRGHLRLLRDEHQRREPPRLHDVDGGPGQRRSRSIRCPPWRW